MNNRKTLVLAALLAISAVLYGQNAGDFEIRDGTLEKYRGNAENVVIPAGVTRIAGRFFSGPFQDNKNLRGVTIPDSVTIALNDSSAKV